jgi:sulfatase modifying factor 1
MKFIHLLLALLLALQALVVACGGSPDAPGDDDSAPDDDDSAPDDDDSAPDDDDSAPDDDDSAPDDDDSDGGCPAGMAPVGDTFCIDRHEAALQEADGLGGWQDASPYEEVAGRTVRAVIASGSIPQGYLSGAEAEVACEAADKRLCSSVEWLQACRGPQDHIWPYGDSRIEGACNDSYAGGHPVVDYFGTSVGVWDAAHMNDSGINQQPGTVAAGGEYPDCVSDWGVFDLHGNLHEWVADAEGVFRGGFYADGSVNGDGCLYTTTAHASSYHDYSTGFRCCTDLPGL